MIEFITITRFITDYFWENKSLSILHVVAPVLIAIIITIRSKRLKIAICNTDKHAAFFLAIMLIPLLLNLNTETAVEYSKFLAYISLFAAGRLTSANPSNIKLIGLFSFASLIGLTTMSLLNLGYLTWGDVGTFSGGYFFKTDLAIACLIFLIFTFATINNKLILSLSFVLASYLVFKSNARIALPLVLIIPAFIVLAVSGKLNSITPRNVMILLTAAIVGTSIFSFIDFRNLGMLGFDFSDPFSAANTQGRSVIWSALLHAYQEAPLVNQIFGSGLSADKRATYLFSESSLLEGVRAHNSYLYLLLCTGITGSLSFYFLAISIIRKARLLLRQDDRHLRVIPSISCALIIMFLWLSMTTEVIIRPQLMTLLFFFSGLHVQSYLNLKKTTRAKMREYSHNS